MGAVLWWSQKSRQFLVENKIKLKRAKILVRKNPQKYKILGFFDKSFEAYVTSDEDTGQLARWLTYGQVKNLIK